MLRLIHDGTISHQRSAAPNKVESESYPPTTARGGRSKDFQGAGFFRWPDGCKRQSLISNSIIRAATRMRLAMVKAGTSGALLLRVLEAQCHGRKLFCPSA